MKSASDESITFKWPVGQILLFIGFLFLVLGARLFVGIRFVAEAPQLDDFDTTHWLQAWKEGHHDWSFIFHRINGHPMELYYLLNLGQFEANGAWDGRLDFISSAIVHTFFAGVALFVFSRLALPQQRPWVFALLLLVFMVPFGGYRVAWGLLWVHTAMIMFAVITIYFGSRRLENWRQVALVLVLAVLAAINNAGGCLASLVVIGLILMRASLNRRMDFREIVTCIACLVIFLIIYLSMPHSHGDATFGAKMSLFLKTIGWPIIFTSIGGFLTLVPLAGLGLGYIYNRELRSRRVEALLGIGAYLVLLAIATGFFRGDERIPSGRYTESLLITPVVCALSLSWLIRTSQGSNRSFWRLFAGAWCLVMVFGFGLHLLYRTLPFMAGGNGEWVEAAKQDRLREISRREDIPLIPYRKEEVAGGVGLLTQPYNESWTEAQVTGQKPFPAMTVPMMTGFPIQLGSSGNFISEGYPPSYAPRPGEHYVGSYDLNQLARDGKNEKIFRSGSFQPTSDYLTMELLVDKAARFSFYRVDGVQLELVDETSAQDRQLLPLLRNTYPSVFRDWELIYFPVVSGHVYHLESQVKGLDGNCWLAFSEPRESGRLTPFIIGFSQSGKLFCLIGALLLTLGVIVITFTIEKRTEISA